MSEIGRKVWTRNKVLPKCFAISFIYERLTLNFSIFRFSKFDHTIHLCVCMFVRFAHIHITSVVDDIQFIVSDFLVGIVIVIAVFVDDVVAF